jgi:hypothetical protein
MSLAYSVVTVVTIVANVAVSILDFAGSRFVLRTAAEVGLPRSMIWPTAVLKSAGAAGLLLGLLGVEPIGIAAAAGLVLFFIGAIVAHVRAGVWYNIAFPGGFLALAVASLALAVAR